MDAELLALSIVRAASAALAGVLAVVALRAFGVTGRRSLLGLGLAAGLLLVGFLAAGALYQLSGSLAVATLVEAPFTLIALGLILASIFAREPPPGGARRVAL